MILYEGEGLRLTPITSFAAYLTGGVKTKLNKQIVQFKLFQTQKQRKDYTGPSDHQNLRMCYWFPLNQVSQDPYNDLVFGRFGHTGQMWKNQRLVIFSGEIERTGPKDG